MIFSHFSGLMRSNNCSFDVENVGRIYPAQSVTIFHTIPSAWPSFPEKCPNRWRFEAHVNGPFYCI